MLSKRKKILTAASFLITIFLISTIFVSSAYAADDWEARSSIRITGDGEFTEAQGVVSGSGTVDDPYVISGWKIGSEDGPGILIKNTREYFVIENNLIENAGVRGDGFDNYYGVRLENVKNAELKNNLIRFNFGGVALDNSSKISLTRNDIESNYIGGVVGYSARKSNFHNNEILRNGLVGITTFFSENNRIINNTIARNGNKIYEKIINVENPSEKYRAVHSGVFLLASQHTLVKNNIISSNQGYGIGISSYSFLQGNLVVSNNIFANEDYGAYFASRTQKNVIHHNNFRNNGGENSQAYDNGVNQWDNGYPSGGNYWGDYPGQDQKNGENQNLSGSDGIGDSSYNIDGSGNKDSYPLMKSTSKKYSLTLITEPENAGTVSGAGSYYEGESVLIEAQPKPSYEFDYWSGDLSGSRNPREILIDSDKTVVAHFFRTKKSKIIPVSGGTIEIKKAKISIPAGALKDETKITMERVSEISPKGLKLIGPGFVFSPENLNSDLPIQITLPYDDSLIPNGGVEDNSRIYKFDSDWYSVGGMVRSENNTVTVSVENLGKFGVFIDISEPENGDNGDSYSLLYIFVGFLSLVFLTLIIFLVYSWKFSGQ